MNFIWLAWTVLIYILSTSLKLKGIPFSGHEANHTDWIKLANASNIVCQDEVLTMQCPNYESIFVLPDAFWGRDDNVTCQEPPTGKNCSHTEMCILEDKEKDDRRIKQACHKEQYCVLLANNYFFRFEEDLCPKVCKYVRLKYECRHMSGMKKSLV